MLDALNHGHPVGMAPSLQERDEGKKEFFLRGCVKNEHFFHSFFFFADLRTLGEEGEEREG